MTKKELGIYIHIPFCKQKCYYCDFVSFAKQEKFEKEYIEALMQEMDTYKFEKYNVTTIYIGGGTPSYIDCSYIVGLVEKIKAKLQNNETKFKDIEITIEINPGTITKQKLENYKKIRNK